MKLVECRRGAKAPAINLHVGQPLKRLDKIAFSSVPAGFFKVVRDGLCRFQQKVLGVIRQFVNGWSKVGESSRLESLSLQRFECSLQ